MLEHLGLGCVVNFVLRYEKQAKYFNHPRLPSSMRIDSGDRFVGGYAIGSIHTSH